MTLDFSHEVTLYMAGDILYGILTSYLENGFPIAESTYTGDYSIEVSQKFAFTIELCRIAL